MGKIWRCAPISKKACAFFLVMQKSRLQVAFLLVFSGLEIIPSLNTISEDTQGAEKKRKLRQFDFDTNSKVLVHPPRDPARPPSHQDQAMLHVRCYPAVVQEDLHGVERLD